MVRTKEKKTLTVDWTPKGLEHNFTEESSMKTWMMAMLVVVTSVVGGSAIVRQGLSYALTSRKIALRLYASSRILEEYMQSL